MVFVLAHGTIAFASTHTLSARIETLAQLQKSTAAVCDQKMVSNDDCVLLKSLVSVLYKNPKQVTSGDMKTLAAIDAIAKRVAIGLPKERIAEALQHLAAASTYASAVGTHVFNDHGGRWAAHAH